MTDGPKLTRTFADKLNGGTLGVAQPPPGYRLVGGPNVIAQREKVAIIGTAPSSRDLAPFGDLSWEIWGCSPGNMNSLKRVDSWFELHANLHWQAIAAQYGTNYLAWLAQQPFPVFLHDSVWHKKYFDHGISFPHLELVKRFGKYWFGSSFAWMVAFAIHKGYKEIGLYGVDMASKEEYILQRQSFFRWIERAEEMGIKVTIPRESDLYNSPPLYGYSDVNPLGRKLHARIEELKGRVAQIAHEKQNRIAVELKRFEENETYLKGALEDQDYMVSIWPSIADEITLEAALRIVTEAGHTVVPPGLKVEMMTTAGPPEVPVLVHDIGRGYEPVFIGSEQPIPLRPVEAEDFKVKRGRGRPKGTKNKSERVAAR